MRSSEGFVLFSKPIILDVLLWQGIIYDAQEYLQEQSNTCWSRADDVSKTSTLRCLDQESTSVCTSAEEFPITESSLGCEDIGLQ